ncbi:hypothetical protein [Streptomyces zagrosensis]|uniref:Transposase n=1 Tax=Streptomyces zagrosensis TaxID=1042984 RepID=A0A7W9Q569_9ACTN|nr:hypothetical protein [Streptomyces zagrosensis]MBB5933579.1 hypothetical protein [Streptomyces zagrosensis]
MVIQTATTHPAKLGRPFTRWSIRRLADYLWCNAARPIRIGREALRCLLRRRGVTFPRTKTWKKSSDPDFDGKLDRTEYAINERPDHPFAFGGFDGFGPLGIRPIGGACWAKERSPDRLPTTFHRTHEITYFHGCHSVGADTLWGVNRRRKGINPICAALRSVRSAHPDCAPSYVVLDNLTPARTRASCAGQPGAGSSRVSHRTRPGRT